MTRKKESKIIWNQYKNLKNVHRNDNWTTNIIKNYLSYYIDCSWWFVRSKKAFSQFLIPQDEIFELTNNCKSIFLFTEPMTQLLTEDFKQNEKLFWNRSGKVMLVSNSMLLRNRDNWWNLKHVTDKERKKNEQHSGKQSLRLENTKE